MKIESKVVTVGVKSRTDSQGANMSKAIKFLTYLLAGVAI
jgi:hypothetical protein